MKGRVLPSLGGLALALALAVLPSCGGEAPELLALEWRLEARPGEPKAYQSLSIFANVHDFDGVDDVESLTLRHLATGLSWTLTDANWTLRTDGEDAWLGGANIAMADRSPLPQGEYSLTVTDLSGQKTERSFMIEGRTPNLPSPKLSLSGKAAKVDSPWPENVLLAYDAAGSLLSARVASQGPIGDLDSLFGLAVSGKTESYALYGYDPGTHFGEYSWKIRR